MKRKQRTKILVKDDLLYKQLSADVEKNHSIQIIQPSETCLVMAKMRESVKLTDFYLCEVLVTEARVEIEGHQGFGILQGNHPEKALALAIIDAAYNANLLEVESWQESFDQASARVEQKERKAFAIVERSKVRFDIMEEYFDGIGKKS